MILVSQGLFGSKFLSNALARVWPRIISSKGMLGPGEREAGTDRVGVWNSSCESSTGGDCGTTTNGRGSGDSGVVFKLLSEGRGTKRNCWGVSAW
jgi:hypothetical protein